MTYGDVARGVQIGGPTVLTSPRVAQNGPWCEGTSRVERLAGGKLQGYSGFPNRVCEECSRRVGDFARLACPLTTHGQDRRGDAEVLTTGRT